MNKHLSHWFELEFIFGGGIRREQNIDQKKYVDWAELDQTVLGAATAAGCSIIENAGLKNRNQHIRVIQELRNAFIHNNCDITKNRNKKSLNMCKEYLMNNSHYELGEDAKDFFFLENNNVIFKKSILMAIRLCLIKGASENLQIIDRQ
jgi:hypothetical protein